MFSRSRTPTEIVTHFAAKELPAVPNPMSGLIEDPLLKLRVLVIDTDLHNGLRNKLYSKFDTGASLILYEMGSVTVRSWRRISKQWVSAG